jgi:hypothetical protein
MRNSVAPTDTQPQPQPQPQKAYFVWVRWKSGGVDRFHITHNAAAWWASNSDRYQEKVRLSTPTGQCITLDITEMVAHKLLVKTITIPDSNRNPLEDDEHYENPCS